MLTLDAEKAFHRLSWTFVFDTCEAFGFNNKFITILKIIYNQPNAKVRVNRTLSEVFMLKRGTRQGDPLSPQIFALCMEPLAESIRKNKTISGVIIGDEEHELALYVDNVENKSLPMLMKEIGKYSAFSGYKLDTQKTEAMTIGEQIERELKNKYNYKWECTKLKYFGTTK